LADSSDNVGTELFFWAGGADRLWHSARLALYSKF